MCTGLHAAVIAIQNEPQRIDAVHDPNLAAVRKRALLRTRLLRALSANKPVVALAYLMCMRNLRLVLVWHHLHPDLIGTGRVIVMFSARCSKYMHSSKQHRWAHKPTRPAVFGKRDRRPRGPADVMAVVRCNSPLYVRIVSDSGLEPHEIIPLFGNDGCPIGQATSGKRREAKLLQYIARKKRRRVRATELQLSAEPCYG